MTASAPVTFINVFEIARDDLEDFTAEWRRLGAVMAAAPGFRGARLHEAVSDETRFQLVNVAEWDSEQAWRDAAANPEMRDAVARAAEGSVMRRAAHHPGLYRQTAAFEA
ncbi:antibiotic biosynthesis monooxygenase [Actinomycetospora lutea]|uniref:antibiotic biosynthesis monooxygenase family protein n=1 Tax=Actinomycetospora lutea TaxID=663604 RepID=UPI00236568D6|nr:antibiotic biosynthesis monooxygenase family protein [Actinomycetospora lutea]MDD7941544.1 antibiotic biosynthesis monooxygenase [Actinomycetospora lutea]